jgi:hypothetical protein
MADKGNDLPKATFEEVKSFVEKPDFSVTVRTERHIQIELQAFNDLLPVMLSRKWVLIKAPERSGGFITSDHPMVLMWSDPKMRAGLYGPGFGLTGTEGHLEKLVSIPSARCSGVNVHESKRERNGIICRQFCGVGE